MITIIQLEYLIALDIHRHFVKAAEHCYVTQPTLSMQIKKLEEELGVLIFDRTKHPIIPTEVGVKIINQSRIIISESKNIKTLVSEFMNSISGSLVIGIIPSLAPYLLPLFIGNLTRKYPDLHIKVIELLTEDIEENLKKDLIDVGILVTPLNTKGIIEQPLFYEEMILYSNRNHEIASSEKIQLDELASSDLWLLGTGHCFRYQVINLCNFRPNKQKKYHFEYESGSLETIKKLVKIEGGFTILPELALFNEDINEKIVLKKFESTPLREISFGYTRNYSKKRLLNILAIEIKKAIPVHLLDDKRGQIVEWKTNNL